MQMLKIPEVSFSSAHKAAYDMTPPPPPPPEFFLGSQVQWGKEKIEKGISYTQVTGSTYTENYVQINPFLLQIILCFV